MFDIWLGDAFLVLLTLWWPIWATMQFSPRLLPGEGVRFLDRVACQVAYERAYRIRFLLVRIIPLVGLSYFGLRLALCEEGKIPLGPSILNMVIAVTGTYFISTIIATFVRRSTEQKFAIAHPEFSDSVSATRPNFIPTLVFIASIAMVVASVAIEDNQTLDRIPLKGGLAMLGGFTLIALGQYQSRSSTYSKHAISWDDPLGQRISEVVALFSKKPKSVFLFPSLVPNAFAMEDGSILITTSLRTIATPGEVAAILAHELSHMRDGEGARYKTLTGYCSLIYTGPLMLMGAVFFRSPLGPLLAPFTGFLVMCLVPLASWILSRFTRKMEFKCDRTAARLGLGPDLASCLDKLTRFTGGPSRWIGLDRYLITHPSLEDRVKEIEKHAKNPA